MPLEHDPDLTEWVEAHATATEERDFSRIEVLEDMLDILTEREQSETD